MTIYFYGSPQIMPIKSVTHLNNVRVNVLNLPYLQIYKLNYTWNR